MNHGENSWKPGKSEGPGANLQAALVDAWKEAKDGGAGPGTYDVKIQLDCENPIRAYIVTITPTG